MIFTGLLNSALDAQDDTEVNLHTIKHKISSRGLQRTIQRNQHGNGIWAYNVWLCFQPGDRIICLTTVMQTMALRCRLYCFEFATITAIWRTTAATTSLVFPA